MYPRSGRPSIEVFWENPPGPDQGVIVRVVHRGHLYERNVKASGYLTAAETARALRRPRKTIYEWIGKGRLKTRRVRGLTVIPVAEVKRLLEHPRG